MVAKVFFTDLRTRAENNLFDKLRRLAKKAGMMQDDYHGKFVAIKIHFGEKGNLAYIRPNYVKVISSLIKKGGGKPFLTDTATLYSGSRSNAINHFTTAMENGFGTDVTGCPVIIADGIKGNRYQEIPIEGTHCLAPKIAEGIVDADILITLNHFKGHELTGFGGAIKNLGMGCGSRNGKLEMHSSSSPVVNAHKCTGCGICYRNCAHDAIVLKENVAVIDSKKCVGCGQCIVVCPREAIQTIWDEELTVTGEKIAEYALAAVKNKFHFHINFVTDISPNCDCWGHNDTPIAPNIGIVASKDPVALDRACVDLVNKAVPLPGSVLEDKGYCVGEDKFGTVHPHTNWKAGLDYAQKIGLGTQQYKLIKL